jgi:RNA 2',3'-cyclic 3'-phosphodiesterase
MPRLFVAIEIGATALDRVADEQERLAETMHPSSLRWTKRDQLHITLVFIGEVSDERAAEVVGIFRDPIPRPPFRFELGGVGTFPPRGAPRALWIGVKSGAEEVTQVQSLLAGRLEAVGVEREQRPFTPHLTLARWRDSRPSDRPRTSATSPPTIARVDVKTVTLFQSRVSSTGSTYSRLAECPLFEKREASN